VNAKSGLVFMIPEAHLTAASRHSVIDAIHVCTRTDSTNFDDNDDFPAGARGRVKACREQKVVMMPGRSKMLRRRW
jgi:hypothetical protein